MRRRSKVRTVAFFVGGFSEMVGIAFAGRRRRSSGGGGQVYENTDVKRRRGGRTGVRRSSRKAKLNY